jgi:VWA domain-containing protein
MAVKKISRQLVPSLALTTVLLVAVGARAQTVQQATDTKAPSRSAVNLLGPPAVGPVVEPTKVKPIDLTKRNFRVDDHDVKQGTDNLDSDNAPLSVAIVVETSSRIEPLLSAIRRTGILFTQSVLGPDGEAAVIGYNDEVDCLLGFTSDAAAIEKAVGKIQMGTPGRRLYDALSEAVTLLQSRPSSRRRVIVVVAEAADNGSAEKLDQVIRKTQLAHVMIYAVALSSTDAELTGPEEQGGPPSATPPGIFAMSPMPGTPQTPTVDALRGGNINLGPLVAIAAKPVASRLRDNPFEIATRATDGLYETTFRASSIEPAIDTIGGELHQ